jgi:hypothetical protein
LSPLEVSQCRSTLSVGVWLLTALAGPKQICRDELLVRIACL